MPDSMASISEKSRDDPREQRALRVARAREEERRGRQVVDGLDAELALRPPRGPVSQTRASSFALLGLVALVAGRASRRSAVLAACRR